MLQLNNFNSFNRLIVSIGLSILISTTTIKGDKLDRIECYQCFADPLQDNHLRCDVEHNLKGIVNSQEKDSFLESIKWKNIFDNENDMWDREMEDDEDDFEDSKQEILNSLKINPCFIVASKVLQMIEDEEEAFYNNIDAINSLNMEVLKFSISAIQFQKRPNSDWIVAEVQLNSGSDMFSFILTDPFVNLLLDISYNSWYYVAF